MAIRSRQKVDVPTLSLVIPAYNERARLPDLLDVLSTTAQAAVASGGMELAEALVVDDGSDDGTRELLCQAEGVTPKLKPVLDFSRNRGRAPRWPPGSRQAEADYVLLADVDLSTPLEELGKLTAAIDAGADVAIGSRAVDGAIVERGPVHRKLLGKTFNGTVRLLTGLDVRDTQNGFKLLPTAAAKQLFAAQTCPGFAFDVELLMRAGPGWPENRRGTGSLSPRRPLKRPRRLRQRPDAEGRLWPQLPPAAAVDAARSRRRARRACGRRFRLRRPPAGWRRP